MIFSLLIPVIVSATKSPGCLVLRAISVHLEDSPTDSLVERRVMCLGGRRAKSFKRPYFPTLSTIQAETSHATPVVSVCGMYYSEVQEIAV